MRFIGNVIEKLQRHPKRVVFPEGEEPRILQAARQFHALRLGAPIVLGDHAKITEVADGLNIPLEGIRIINPATSEELENFVKRFHSLRREKGLRPNEAREAMLQPNYFGTMMLAMHQADGVISGASPFGFMIARMVAGGVTTDVLINALEQKGIARSLAEPNLVALSGDTASFLAGGEYPIPVAGTFGQVTVDYKKYGVGLAFTPTVLDRGLINLKIEPEVSQIDTTHTISVTTGVAVPALIVRRASTTIELRDGQSFMIGGLLQTNTQNQIEQLPWLGSVPVLGTLFSSKSYQQNQTDLAIIVTPHLVRPTRPGDMVKTPADDSLPPNDPDFFLLGKTELTRGQALALTPGADQFALAGSRPFTGHMLDLPKRVSDAVIQ